jgi:hypothetical protein
MQRVCRAHGCALAAAALQFPVAHPCVACVIPGARSVSTPAAPLLTQAPRPTDKNAPLQPCLDRPPRCRRTCGT